MEWYRIDVYKISCPSPIKRFSVMAWDEEDAKRRAMEHLNEQGSIDDIYLEAVYDG